uniref:killer cell lectin-like receptor subfamily B member 1F n=1 Tax=Arvicanthis niloticus TaxID=61156 RepID=UPI00402BEE58
MRHRLSMVSSGSKGHGPHHHPLRELSPQTSTWPSVVTRATGITDTAAGPRTQTWPLATARTTDINLASGGGITGHAQQKQCTNRTSFLSSLGRSAILECPRYWHQHWNKCLFISQISKPWIEGLAACSIKDATLLHIENKEELRFVQNFIKGKEQLFFIGLNYVQEEKVWKWINGSILNPDLLRTTGKDVENSCALISHTEVFSDSCSSDNHWICQKTLKHV